MGEERTGEKRREAQNRSIVFIYLFICIEALFHTLHHHPTPAHQIDWATHIFIYIPIYRCLQGYNILNKLYAKLLAMLYYAVCDVMLMTIHHFESISRQNVSHQHLPHLDIVSFSSVRFFLMVFLCQIACSFSYLIIMLYQYYYTT